MASKPLHIDISYLTESLRLILGEQSPRMMARTWYPRWFVWHSLELPMVAFIMGLVWPMIAVVAVVEAVASSSVREWMSAQFEKFSSKYSERRTMMILIIAQVAADVALLAAWWALRRRRLRLQRDVRH